MYLYSSSDAMVMCVLTVNFGHVLAESTTASSVVTSLSWTGLNGKELMVGVVSWKVNPPCLDPVVIKEKLDRYLLIQQPRHQAPCSFLFSCSEKCWEEPRWDEATNSTYYSGTPLNGRPSTTDTCNITDNSECPDCISIDFNTFKPPQQRILHYSV